MEEQHQNTPQTPPVNPAYQPYDYTPPPRYVFPMGKSELLFGVGILLFSLLLCNSLVMAGLNLGFAVGAAGILGCTYAYLRSRGHRPDWYAAALLILSLVITAAFPRSDDGILKFLAVWVLLLAPSLAFCLMAGQNRRSPAGIASLLDGPRALFTLGVGRMAESGRGIREACKSTGTVGKTGGAVALGLLIAVPMAAILVPLLMRADAAFEGLLKLLPEFRWDELLTTVLLGGCMGCVFYTRGAALHHLPKTPAQSTPRKGLSAVTVNTVLTAAALIYGVYLVSQLAYFVGGFSGILPEEYTLAQYARRGFFEMAWLCAINLSLIALAVALVSARGKTPLSTRILCLFLGLVTLFLVCAASAKMLLYIRSYGLSRLRVLTEVFMVWLALTTVFVCVWLFRPQTAYMKLTLLLGLALFAGLLWADVDTQVARYNVQRGQLETVDVDYLGMLSSGAVPYLAELAQDGDRDTAAKAKTILTYYGTSDSDIRGWNYAKAKAQAVLEEYEALQDDYRSAEVTGQ